MPVSVAGALGGMRAVSLFQARADSRQACKRQQGTQGALAGLTGQGNGCANWGMSRLVGKAGAEEQVRTWGLWWGGTGTGRDSLGARDVWE